MAHSVGACCCCGGCCGGGGRGCSSLALTLVVVILTGPQRAPAVSKCLPSGAGAHPLVRARCGCAGGSLGRGGQRRPTTHARSCRRRHCVRKSHQWLAIGATGLSSSEGPRPHPFRGHLGSHPRQRPHLGAAAASRCGLARLGNVPDRTPAAERPPPPTPPGPRAEALPPRRVRSGCGCGRGWLAAEMRMTVGGRG
eukprot:scaffold990_cov393-Prasinococcus_capsulatus_cf.AAC.47